MNRRLAAALTSSAIVWASLIVAAPMALHSEAAVMPTAVIYSASTRICHQRPERSFSIAGFQMPVCARCAALYLSAAAGTLLAWRTRAARTDVPRVLLVAAALPTALTFTLEIAGVMRFSNTARAIAALPLGAFAGWLFVRMLRYDSRLDAHENADS